MRVADVLALSASSIAYSGSSDDSKVESSLIEKYLTSLDLSVPTMVENNAPSLLLYKREEAHRTPNDEYYITDDPKVRQDYGFTFFPITKHL